MSQSFADQIDEYIRAQLKNQRIPGLSLAVVRDGKPVKIAGYGVANVELNTPATADTVFRISSISKQFLATAVMLLVRDGKIALDDHVDRYVRDVPDTWAPITVRHLLTHTSGLQSESPGFDPLGNQGNEQLIRKAYARPVLSQPGERFLYSNLGYYVLAQIIENATKEPWPNFLNERIFEPLKMAATRTATLSGIVPNRAAGYIFRDDVFTNAPPLITLRASGSLLSSVVDVATWDAALSARRLVPQDAQRLMWTSATLPDGSLTHYGFGWWVDDVRGHRRVRHGGSNPGYASEYSRFDDNLSVIVLTNGGCARPDAIALDIADHYMPGLSPPRSTVELGVDVLGRYAGRYEFGPSDVVAIKVDGDGLSVQNDTPAFSSQCKLLAESPTKFFIASNESWVFSLKDGVATGLTVEFGEQKFPAVKLR